MDEIGTCTIASTFGDYTRILTADPRVRIGHVFIAEARSDDHNPHLHLDGDVLTVRDDYGARFIYRIRWDDYADGGYLAEWPD